MFVAADIARAAVGGSLVGLSTAGMLYTHGRLSGITGIVGGAMHPKAQSESWSWRAAFIAGLLVSGLIARVVRPDLVTLHNTTNVVVLAVAGLLAGFGARISGGCTSGHGICGIGSFSLRSMAATGTFMVLGAVVVYTMRHVLFGGGV
ncbi:MAG: YeeE/YedE family protein [Sandaracinaceae bacterium]|nr:YeeE/YedE family protein [Sandaracinaceae bacterium]